MRHLASDTDIERRAADIGIAWHEQTDHWIVYWGGLAHTANGLAACRNAGSYLRERFDSGYVSIALTFHHGSLPPLVDAPPSDYVEAVLGAVNFQMYLLKIHDIWSEPLREWLGTPTKTRSVGPGTHELRGRSLWTWFDFIIHSQRITPAHPL